MGLLLILLNRSTPTASFARSRMRLHSLFFGLFVLNGFLEKPVNWSKCYRRGRSPPQPYARLEKVIGAHLSRDQLEESVLNNRKCVSPVIKALTPSCFGMILG